VQAAETMSFTTSQSAVGHYENFPVGSVLLPARFRRPVGLIYRFAREADDFADEGTDSADVRLARLDGFREELARIEAGDPPTIEWFAALAAAIREYHLPIQAFRDLLSAFAQDVVKTRYATYGEVLDYCRRSANPVGRLLLCLYGSPGPQSSAQSDAICSSLQIINFLQDVSIDYGKGRIYLPQDEMARFGITEEHIARHECSGNWSSFMTFQIDRARALLYSGAPLGRALKGRLGLEMRMIIAGGDRILQKITRVQGDIYRSRPVLRAYDWPLMLVRAFA
jgi:squalene synthase HpnC